MHSRKYERPVEESLRRRAVLQSGAVALAVGALHATAVPSFAQPGAPGVVPDRVGKMDPDFVRSTQQTLHSGWNGVGALAGLGATGLAAGSIFGPLGAVVGGVAGAVGGLIVAEITQAGSNQVDDAFSRLQARFQDVYREMDARNVSLGWPINDVHFWDRVLIQDFRSGAWGDGAIIVSPGQGSRPGAVVGRHWQAYINADGSNRLLTPINGFLHTDRSYADGWWAQEFQGGIVVEQAGRALVWRYDENRWQQVLG